jgi:hypothetical protein
MLRILFYCIAIVLASHHVCTAEELCSTARAWKQELDDYSIVTVAERSEFGYPLRITVIPEAFSKCPPQEVDGLLTFLAAEVETAPRDRALKAYIVFRVLVFGKYAATSQVYIRPDELDRIDGRRTRSLRSSMSSELRRVLEERHSKKADLSQH